ncbi:MAG: DNA translocase FtsK 4TM domain-containing protein [Acidobacteria bacterium]|nr:DNA translocase FtsK 4TM domain-containing protein [Acidobacteriota bacterium]
MGNRVDEDAAVESQAGAASPVSEGKALSLRQEITIILVFTAALLTLLALISYNPGDPGLMSKGTLSFRPTNWVGYLGSFWADLLVSLFGLAALWVPVLLARAGYLLFFQRPLLSPGRLIVWTSLLFSQATLLQMTFGNVDLGLCEQGVATALGGISGIVLGTMIVGVAGNAGALILVPLWVIVTLMALFSVSFFGILSRFASPFQKLWQAIALRRERKRQAEARDQARLQVKQRQKERLLKEDEEAKERGGPAVAKRKDVKPALPLEASPSAGKYKLPQSDLLEPQKPRPPIDEKALLANARLIEERLREFEINGEVVEIHPGPVVTIFEFRPAPGIKYNRVIAYAEDLALTMKVDHVRIDRILGKSTIGVEVPNKNREIISFREMVESEAYRQAPGKLPIAMGKTVDGEPFVTTLDHLPHLLVAGTTGSGKSVGINVLLHSILFRATPDEVKLILIDPKQVELKIYEGIPHLLVPVVTDVKKAANALNWAVREMTERYKLLAAAQVRSIDQYNQYVRTLTPNRDEANLALTKPLPYVIIVIDELYDLMAVVAKEVETAIARLSAMARAVGIHLILATQRPSRDVITGVIKSNLPSRAAFQVREKLESRLILDQNGAELLEGKGDMLYLPSGSGRLIRVHGAFLSTVETQRVINFLQKQGEPVFDTQVLKETPAGAADGGSQGGSEPSELEDPLYNDSVALVVRTGVASASNLQRRMRIGYARAARLLDVMEQRGVVGPADGAKPRDILIKPQDLE